MEVPDRSARSRYLLPLVVQVWLVPGTGAWDTYAPWYLRALSAAVTGLLLAHAVRNVVRLWRAPAHEAGWRNVVAHTLVGGTIALIGSGMVFDSMSWESRLDGMLVLPFGLALLTLAAREGRRTVTRLRVLA